MHHHQTHHQFGYPCDHGTLQRTPFISGTGPIRALSPSTESSLKLRNWQTGRKITGVQPAGCVIAWAEPTRRLRAVTSAFMANGHFSPGLPIVPRRARVRRSRSIPWPGVETRLLSEARKRHS